MPTPPEIPRQGAERETLNAFLDYYRALLLHKASDITDEQLHTAVHPSDLTLGGLLHHMAAVEDGWFTVNLAGGEMPEPFASAPWDEDRDWELTIAPDVPTDTIIERYLTAIDRSRAVADATDLDAVEVKTWRPGTEPHSLRWILVHMIEEYARHCGHADFLRQAIDGQIGDFGDA